MIWVVVEGNTCPSSKYIKPPETRLPSCESYANSFNSGRLNLLTLVALKAELPIFSTLLAITVSKFCEP